MLVAAAVAVAIVIVDPRSSGPQPVTAAQARMILRGAKAGLAIPAGAVLHTAYTQVAAFPNGKTSRSRGESWSVSTRPYAQRSISSTAGQRAEETAVSDGRLELYDAQRNTIYTNESPPPYSVRGDARAGRYLLTLKPDRVPSATITTAQLQGLRDGRDTIVITSTHHAMVIPYSSLERPAFDARAAALKLLRSRHAQVRPHVPFAGQTAIEISGPGPDPRFRTSYFVAPRTYHPLGMVQRFGPQTWIARFTNYQLLPGTTGNRALVTLAGAHPSARIDTDAADFIAAAARLFG